MGKVKKRSKTKKNDSRLKVTYRNLASRLHPDRRPENQKDNKTLDELWYELQEAYEEHDMETMERIEAVCDAELTNLEGESSISRIGMVIEHCKDSIRILDRSIRKNRKHPAWRFSEKPDLKIRYRKEIESELNVLKASFTERLLNMEKNLAKWSEPPPQRKKTYKKTDETVNVNQGTFEFF